MALRPLPASRLLHLNATLRPIAKTNSSAPPYIALRALAYRARSVDIPSDELLTWLVVHSGLPDVAALASRPSTLRPLLADADAHHARSSSPAGRADMRRGAAEMLVGHLLLPVAGHRRVTPVSAANARRCLAVLGAEFLSRAGQDGYDSIYYSEPEMAHALGLSRLGARGLLATCKKAGWVTSPKSRRGAPSRWRLRRLNDDQKALLWAFNYESLVEALAQGDPTNGFVDVFFSADHAAFGYGHVMKDGKTVDASLGHYMWLTAIASEVAPHPVAVDEEALEDLRRGKRAKPEVQVWIAEVGAVLGAMGVSPNSARSLTREWLKTISGANGDPTSAALDAYAASTSADVEMAQAREERDADVAQRIADRDTRRAEKAQQWEERKARLAEKAKQRMAKPPEHAEVEAKEQPMPRPAPVSIERIRVALPDGFDPEVHGDALLRKIVGARGEGWEVESIDLDSGKATAVRKVSIPDGEEGAA